MKITFISTSKDRLSSLLNIPNFEQLNNVCGISFFLSETPVVDSDIILIMGYDAKCILELKKNNPNAKIGIVDPRPGSLEYIRKADFIVANGWEMRDTYADIVSDIFIYPIYTEIPPSLREHTQQAKIRIGYHGNKVNLQIMQPVISDAINRLGKEIPLEIHAFYDVKNLGDLTKPICAHHVDFKAIQFDDQKVLNFLSNIDIGIVPNHIPSKISWLNKIKTKFYRGIFNEHESDILLRYKSTANPGRLFFFMQANIPIVAGALPSTSQLIRDGKTGYLATTSGAWYQALKTLATSAQKRNEISRAMRQEYDNYYAIPKLNSAFIEFLHSLRDRDNQC